MDAEKYLSENYNGFFDEFDITELQDIIQAMEDYSKEQLLTQRVSKRSELLAFLDWHYEDDIADKKTKETIVDTYLSKS